MPYSGNPGASPEDEVRFLLGDTESSPRLSDAEVAWLVATYEKPVRAAYQGALRLLARYSGKMDKAVGPTRIAYSGLVGQYRTLLADLKAQGGDIGGGRPVPTAPFASGLQDTGWSDVEWSR